MRNMATQKGARVAVRGQEAYATTLEGEAKMKNAEERKKELNEKVRRRRIRKRKRRRRKGKNKREMEGAAKTIAR